MALFTRDAEATDTQERKTRVGALLLAEALLDIRRSVRGDGG